MPARSKRRVNLVMPSEFEQTFWGKFLLWLSGQGRYVILIVEAVVIVAFLSRFKLDHDMAELTTTIEGQRRVVQSLSIKEKEFLSVQKQMSLTEQLMNFSKGPSEAIQGVMVHIPEKVKLLSISYEPNTILMTGQTFSSPDLGKMLASLSSDGQWKNVDLTNISSVDGSVINFSISLTSK